MVFAGLFSALVKQSAPATSKSWQLDSTITEPQSVPNWGSVIDMSTDGNHIVISMNDGGSFQGYCAVYSKNTSTHTWSLKGSIVTDPSNGDKNNFHSAAIDDSGDTFVTGIRLNTLSSGGYVNVWQYVSNQWVAKGTHGTAADPALGEIYPGSTKTAWGQIVGISANGNTVATTETSGRKIWIFDWNGSNWNLRTNTIGGTTYDYVRTANLDLQADYFYFHKGDNTIIANRGTNQCYVVEYVNNVWVEKGGDISVNNNDSNLGRPFISYDKTTVTTVASNSAAASVKFPRILEYNSGSSSWDIKGTNGGTIIPFDNGTEIFDAKTQSVFLNSDGTSAVYRDSFYEYDGSSWTAVTTPKTSTNYHGCFYYDGNRLVMIEQLHSTNTTANRNQVHIYSYRNLPSVLIASNFSVTSELQTWAAQNSTPSSSTLPDTQVYDNYTVTNSSNSFANGDYELRVTDLNSYTSSSGQGNVINQVLNPNAGGFDGFDFPGESSLYTSGTANTSGNFTVTVDTNSNNYYGSALQLTMPYSLQLKQLQGKSSSNNNNPPNQVTLLGSNDGGTTWDYITTDNFTTATQTGVETLTPTIYNSTPYSTIRMVIEEFHGGGGSSVLEYFNLIGDVY